MWPKPLQGQSELSQISIVFVGGVDHWSYICYTCFVYLLGLSSFNYKKCAECKARLSTICFVYNDPNNRHRYPGQYSRCRFVANKLVPKSAPIRPMIRHGSLFGKCIGSNKRSVPKKCTVSSDCNTRE